MDVSSWTVDFSRSKYKNWSSFYRAKVVRGFLRFYLRTLIKWPLLENPETGYSVVIACNYNLRGILDANLQLIAKQDHDNMKALYVVFEVTEEEFPKEFRDDILQRYPELPIKFVFYDRYQSRGLRAIDWPWTYSWLSWCKSIAICRTRYILLHDYDALPIRQDFFEDRFRQISAGRQSYFGCSYYQHNGITPDDKLATTWELFIDVDFIRRQFRPIDIFNQVAQFRDRLLDFDTFLYAQKCAGTTSVVTAQVPEELVHLSQVISQHTQVMNGRQKVAENVLFIPYMFFVAGNALPINQTTQILDESSWPDLVYMGKSIKTTELDKARAEWIVRHIEATEMALLGYARERVSTYCRALLNYVARGKA